jgi:hypothetical protein
VATAARAVLRPEDMDAIFGDDYFYKRFVEVSSDGPFCRRFSRT